jgi:hypothetical protein
LPDAEIAKHIILGHVVGVEPVTGHGYWKWEYGIDGKALDATGDRLGLGLYNSD